MTGIPALDAKITELKAEFPSLSFGYIGNVGVDRSGPFDDRSWYVFLPHPGRVGTPADCVGGYRTANLPVMLADWDSRVLPAVRRGMAGR